MRVEPAKTSATPSSPGHGSQVIPDGAHPVLRLWHELDSAGPTVLPEGADPLTGRRTDGIAFFPVGSGLWGTVKRGVPPPLRRGGVMLLGNDFSNTEDADRIVRRGSEVTLLDGTTSGSFKAGPTWRNLIKLLDRAGVERGSCFFTNAYMALIHESSNIGSLEVGWDHPFEQWCRDFFLRQVDLTMPRAVVALGSHAAAFLSRAAGGIPNWPLRPQGWFAPVDRADAAVREARVRDHRLSVTAVVHPSFSTLNAGLRRYRGGVGPEAEVAMVRDATGR